MTTSKLEDRPMTFASLAKLRLVAPLAALVACASTNSGPGVDCSYKGSCPNDPPPQASDVAKCESIVSDPKCGSLFQAYYACALPLEKCTPAGKVDNSASAAAVLT